MNFFLIKTKGFFNGRNCKYSVLTKWFFLSELIVNRILIVSIVINKICPIIIIIIIIIIIYVSYIHVMAMLF